MALCSLTSQVLYVPADSQTSSMQSKKFLGRRQKNSEVRNGKLQLSCSQTRSILVQFVQILLILDQLLVQYGKFYLFQTKICPNWTKSWSETGKLHFPIADLLSGLSCQRGAAKIISSVRLHFRWNGLINCRDEDRVKQPLAPLLAILIAKMFVTDHPWRCIGNYQILINSTCVIYM